MSCLAIVGWLILGSLIVRGTQADDTTAAKRPNVLLIFTDDQSYKTVGCYPEAYAWVHTPNIDALAKTGIRFSHSYFGAWCMPSRATMLTGKLPHGIESMRMAGTYPGSTYDPTQTPFWPAVFRKNGYHTAHIGKWHTGVDSGLGRDWDHQIVWNRPKHPENAGNYYENQIVSFNGKERMVESYSTDNYTKWACEYIRGENRDERKPWYLWLCYGGVHGPSHPAARHVGKYDKEPVATPVDIFPPRPEKPAYLKKTQSWVKGPNGQPVTSRSGEAFGDDSAKNAKTHAQWVRQVNECAMSLDEGVGEVMKALQESGQLDNTLVVFTADQGFAMGEHGFRSKLAPYDATFRSPLIISMPSRLPQGKLCKQPVAGTDLVVTFFRFTGQQLPWKMHGRDLTPLLKDPAGAKWPYPVLFEHTGRVFGSDTTKQLAGGTVEDHSNVPWWIAIRHGKYKYVRNLVAGEMEEIYDSEKDPEELKNLALLPENEPLLKELRQLAIDELRRTDAGIVDYLPPTAAMKK
jgi:arylsulfatase A-like enzyme